MSNEPGFLRKAISIRGLIEVVFFGSCILTIAGFLGKFGWLLDLTSHFRVQYSIIQLLCVVFLLIKKRWRLVAVALLFAGMNMVQIIPWYIHDSRPTDANTTVVGKLRILLINVNTYNTDYDKTIQYIQEINPDVLALEEINDSWLSALSGFLFLTSWRKSRTSGTPQNIS